MNTNDLAAALSDIRHHAVTQDCPKIANICGLASIAIQKLDETKNQAYTERNALVCALSKLFPAWLERHPAADKDWEDDWRWIVFINLPTGQCSWHIHDSEYSNFEHLNSKEGNSWDGHTTEEKYQRIADLLPAHPNKMRGKNK